MGAIHACSLDHKKTMKRNRTLNAMVGPMLVMAVASAVWAFREQIFQIPSGEAPTTQVKTDPTEKLELLELGSQARKNLKLTSAPARPTDYWRTITIPGAVEDRPGVSDRGITSPAVGNISEIHVYPGDTVKPGERLVTIKLFSEYLQSTQTQLYKASQEIALLRKEISRLSSVASSGAISQSRIIELNNDVRRQETIIQASKQELLNRGLAPSQVEQISSGIFVSTIDVVAPPPRSVMSETSSSPESLNIVSPSSEGLNETTPNDVNAARKTSDEDESNIGQNDNGTKPNTDDQITETISYEVQKLSVDLGQTVQAGELISELSNHRHLYIVGHAFKREAGWLERAASENRSVEVEFADDSAESWQPLDQTFEIRHLSNTIDQQSRTFDFYLPLVNQSQLYENAGETFLLWRFRPGQRTRIHVPVEKLENVFVLPAEAVAYEGPNAFVYRQNGDLFNQIAVHVLHQDHRHAVIANDGSITPGTFLAQNAGASLRRVLKSQSASGEQPGLHVHADGTVHAAH